MIVHVVNKLKIEHLHKLNLHYLDDILDFCGAIAPAFHLNVQLLVAVFTMDFVEWKSISDNFLNNASKEEKEKIIKHCIANIVLH